MSDSDDTDVLLLIPPDLFTVASSDSEDDSRLGRPRKYRETSVVSEILEHVQSLENRINVIESRDNSLEVSLLNASLDSYLQAPSHPILEYPPAKISQPTYSLSQLSSLQNTPIKPLCCSSSKSSPGCLPLSVVTNTPRRNPTNCLRRSRPFNATNQTNVCSSRTRQQQQELMNFESPVKQPASAEKIKNSFKIERNFGHSFAADHDKRRKPFECSIHAKTNFIQGAETNVEEMELSEVDELLQEMEATQIELAKRIDNSKARRCSDEREANYSASCSRNLRENKFTAKSPMRRLDFQFADEDFHRPFASLNFPCDKAHADVSLPEDISLSEDTKARITDFKVWDKSADISERTRADADNKNAEKILKTMKQEDRSMGKVSDRDPSGRSAISSATEIPELREQNPEHPDVESQMSSSRSLTTRSLSNIKNSTIYSQNGNTETRKLLSNGFSHDGTNDTVDSGLQGTRQSRSTNELQQTIREIRMTGKQGSNISVAKTSENCPRQEKHLFSSSIIKTFINQLLCFQKNATSSRSF